MSDVVQQIKQKVNLLDYIRKEVPSLAKKGRYWKACCPFHSEKTPSFLVNEETQSWYCFGACQEGGDLFSFVMKSQSVDFSEAVKILAGEAGISLADSPKYRNTEALRSILKRASELFAANLFSSAGKSALDYLLSRQYSLDTIRDFGLGYGLNSWMALKETLIDEGFSPEIGINAGILSKSDYGKIYDTFRNRIIIPITNEMGTVVAFGSRIIPPNEDGAKYINSRESEIFKKGQLLFNLHSAKPHIQKSNSVVVVEGYMDAIALYNAGVKNVVAVMGASLHDDHIRALHRLTNHIVLAFDNDQSGEVATKRSIASIPELIKKDWGVTSGVKISIVDLNGAKDPDDYIRAGGDIANAIKNASSLIHYLIKYEYKSLPSNDIADRMVAIRNLFPVVASIETPIGRHDAIGAISKQFEISGQDLTELFKKEHPNLTSSVKSSVVVPTTQPAKQPQKYPKISQPQYWDILTIRAFLAKPRYWFEINKLLTDAALDNSVVMDTYLQPFCVNDFSSDFGRDSFVKLETSGWLDGNATDKNALFMGIKQSHPDFFNAIVESVSSISKHGGLDTGFFYKDSISAMLNLRIAYAKKMLDTNLAAVQSASAFLTNTNHYNLAIAILTAIKNSL